MGNNKPTEYHFIRNKCTINFLKIIKYSTGSAKFLSYSLVFGKIYVLSLHLGTKLLVTMKNC